MARRSPALLAWTLCGALDIVYAAVSSVVQGGTVSSMLHAVASGPFGDGARQWGVAGDIAELATHFAIMGAMVAFWFQAVRIRPALAERSWWLSGTIYGLILYLVMYAAVLPLRFGSPFPPTDLVKGAIALFPHIVFVGWPLAWLTRKETR